MFNHSRPSIDGVPTQIDTKHLFQGTAGKFSFIPLFINLGAGLALLGLATVICDVIVLYCMKDKDIYYDKKYLQVRGSDAFNVYRGLDSDDNNEVRARRNANSEEGPSSAANDGADGQQ